MQYLARAGNAISKSVTVKIVMVYSCVSPSAVRVDDAPYLAAAIIKKEQHLTV